MAIATTFKGPSNHFNALTNIVMALATNFKAIAMLEGLDSPY